MGILGILNLALGLEITHFLELGKLADKSGHGRIQRPVSVLGKYDFGYTKG